MPERDDAAFLPKEQAALERGEEFRGRFWLFDDAGTATSGVLRWSLTDGAELWLIGPPTDWPGVWGQGSQKSADLRIYGLIGSNGTKVTIPDGLVTSSSFGTGITQLRVSASSLILFQHLDGSERWKRILLRTGNLHEWLSITGFGDAHAIFDHRSGAREYTVTWKAPRGKRVALRDAEIRFSTRMQTDPTHWKPERIIRTTMDAAVIARDPATVESLHTRFLVPLRDLMVVLGGFPDDVTVLPSKCSRGKPPRRAEAVRASDRSRHPQG